jgi:hypothetical protein
VLAITIRESTPCPFHGPPRCLPARRQPAEWTERRRTDAARDKRGEAT